jgi:hypothetical protein
MRLSIYTFAILMSTAGLFAQQQPEPDSVAPDEPGRPVARLSVMSGDASVRRGDSGEWVAAVLNAPLMAGDSISVPPGGAVEVQLDRAHFARLAGDSEIRLSVLENGRYQIQLAKGLVTYRILRDSAVQAEISTPLVAVRPVRQGTVRVEVAPDGSTRAIVRHGDADVFNPKGTEHVHEGSVMLVRGSPDEPEYQVEYAPAPDQWDTWSDQRDAYLLRARSPNYVSQDVYGTEDLDNYGRWNNDPAYGDVWTPNVPATWAPYRNGQWVWEDYYGWTWVDYDPWGWAPFHYGSWYQRPGFGWSWFPGHRYEHFWWRPALVGFFGFGRGGLGVGFGFGNVGWVPLAPFERFHPWYGRGWYGAGRTASFTNINIHNTNITNVYRNARFSNGVTAVTANDFQRGNFRSPVSVDRAQLQQASLVRGAVPVTAGAENMRFTGRAASTAGPRSDIGNQRFFSRTGGSQTSAPQTIGQRPGSLPRTNAAPGWQRFGGPQASGPAQSQQRFGAPGASQFGSGGRNFSGGSNSSERSLQVAPPIVQQRSVSPQYNAPSPNRGGGFGAPSYRSAPPASYRNAPAPSYRSAPSAPSYRSAPSAPSYRSAPAPSYRSAPAAPSVRGGGSGGGGHASSGGHGGRR